MAKLSQTIVYVSVLSVDPLAKILNEHHLSVKGLTILPLFYNYRSCGHVTYQSHLSAFRLTSFPDQADRWESFSLYEEWKILILWGKSMQFWRCTIIIIIVLLLMMMIIILVSLPHFKVENYWPVLFKLNITIDMPVCYLNRRNPRKTFNRITCVL